MRASKSTTAPQRTFEGSQPAPPLALASGWERYVRSPVHDMRDDLFAVLAADRSPRQPSTPRQLRALALGGALAVCTATCATFWLFVARLALSVV